MAEMLDILILMLALSMLTAGQLLQKLAAGRASARLGYPAGISELLRQPQTWWAVACMIAGTALWLCVLYRMDVSKAFPALSLVTIAIVLISRFYLGETISPRRWIGIALVVAGVLLVGST